ncbi:hypothetical protein IMCC1989_2502 [gamma proteobacterium IMCC1989]|nr:hypothetical protein IMCC1989_2502 [gamma proteobacterium IMCC1989]
MLRPKEYTQFNTKVIPSIDSAVFLVNFLPTLKIRQHLNMFRNKLLLAFLLLGLAALAQGAM